MLVMHKPCTLANDISPRGERKRRGGENRGVDEEERRSGVG